MFILLTTGQQYRSWEIVNSFPIMQVSRERFTEDTFVLIMNGINNVNIAATFKTIGFWLVHWLWFGWAKVFSLEKNISLQQAISFIDGLGIMRLILRCLIFGIRRIKKRWFQILNNRIPGLNSGNDPDISFRWRDGKNKSKPLIWKALEGHHIEFEGKNIPIKFNKHYSLRSKNQDKKLVQNDYHARKEKVNEAGHTHIELMIEQQTQGWNKNDLLEWERRFF